MTEYIGDPRHRLNQIEQFTQIRLAQDDSHSSCSICISTFTKDEIVLILPCVHKFHRFCIQPWLSANNTCPTCREKVLDDIHCNVSIGDENSDSDIEVEFSDVSDNSQLSSPVVVIDLLNSYFNPTEDSLSEVSFQSSVHLDGSSSTGSVHSLPSTTLEMDADDSDSSISVSSPSSHESVNIISESQSNDSSSNESSDENDDSDIMFPDSEPDSSDGMLTDGSGSDDYYDEDNNSSD